MNDTFKQYSKTKDAEAKINEAKDAAKREYDDRANAYKSKLDALKDMPNGGPRNNAIAEIKAMEKEINDFRITREKELQDQGLRLRTDIVKDIEDFIREKYSTNGVPLIVDVSGHSLNNVPWVMFSQTIPDLTQDIIAALNKASETSSRNRSFPLTQELRFGHVNVDKAIKSLPERSSIEAEIEAEKNRAKAKLGDHPNAAAQAGSDKQLETFAATRRNPMIDRVMAAVATIGKAQGFNFILDSSGQSLNGVPIALVSKEIPDLTNQVIAALSGNGER
jgi:outer membrane protein